MGEMWAHVFVPMYDKLQSMISHWMNAVGVAYRSATAYCNRPGVTVLESLFRLDRVSSNAMQMCLLKGIRAGVGASASTLKVALRETRTTTRDMHLIER